MMPVRKLLGLLRTTVSNDAYWNAPGNAGNYASSIAAAGNELTRPNNDRLQLIIKNNNVDSTYWKNPVSK
jgi:DsbC/DsbD-like thiol-disulfide interchange protein